MCPQAHSMSCIEYELYIQVQKQQRTPALISLVLFVNTAWITGNLTLYASKQT